MPGGDRTGPMGWGPMTGRGAGYCAGFGMPGYANPIPGRGHRFGRGRGGRGRHGRFYGGGFQTVPTPYGYPPYPYGSDGRVSKQDEIADLKDQARYFSDALEEINRRIDELQRGKEG